jgi:hypothetical protein
MTQFRRDDSILWRTLGAGVLLLPQSSPRPHTLTGAGSALWELLALPRSREEIIQGLAEQFQLSPDQISPSIELVLDELRQIGAIVAVEA